MKNGKCTKCGSHEIWMVEQKYQEGGRFQVGMWYHMGLDRYCCFKCGFTEEYISPAELQKPEKMAKAREKMTKV